MLGRFFFQTALISVAAVIPAGAMAERWRFPTVVPYRIFISALPLAIFGYWVWGGGWLSRLNSTLGLGRGFHRFCRGLGCPHGRRRHWIDGGSGAWAAHRQVRAGRATAANPGRANLVYVIVGTILLAVGWFGFNLGPAVFMGGLSAPLIVVNTLLAAVAGGAAAYAVVTMKFRKPDPSMVCNGLLAGLVAISASCAFVNPTGAALTGAIAGIAGGVHRCCF